MKSMPEVIQKQVIFGRDSSKQTESLLFVLNPKARL